MTLRVQGIAYAANHAMEEAAKLTLRQHALGELAPGCELRVAELADVATTAMKMVLINLGMNL